MDFSAKATTKDARLLQAPPALFVTAPFLDSTGFPQGRHFPQRPAPSVQG